MVNGYVGDSRNVNVGVPRNVNVSVYVTYVYRTRRHSSNEYERGLNCVRANVQRAHPLRSYAENVLHGNVHDHVNGHGSGRPTES